MRLGKWYSTYSQKERAKISKEVFSLITGRTSKQCNFLDYRDMKLVYRWEGLQRCLCSPRSPALALKTLRALPRLQEVRVAVLPGCGGRGR